MYLNKEEREIYENDLKALRIHKAEIKTAEEKGREEGKEEVRRQLILKQYRKGLSVEYIADINEFDVEYVKNIVTKG
jgi:predicted transposase/invertase (TIGR01784 family)